MIKKPKRPKKWKPKIILKDPCEDLIQEIERLRESILKHKKDIWGDQEVGHEADIILYEELLR